MEFLSGLYPCQKPLNLIRSLFAFGPPASDYRSRFDRRSAICHRSNGASDLGLIGNLDAPKVKITQPAMEGWLIANVTVTPFIHLGYVQKHTLVIIIQPNIKLSMSKDWLGAAKSLVVRMRVIRIEFKNMNLNDFSDMLSGV